MQRSGRGSAYAYAALVFAVFTGGLMPAMHRHFQVDELQNGFNIHLLGLADANRYLNNFKPFMVPLGWMTAALPDSASFYLTLRFVFYCIFILNFWLLAEAQPYFRSLTGRAVVFAVGASIVQLWEYGFEIRHDALMLTGCLVVYGATQRLISLRMQNAERGAGRLELPARWPLVAGVASVFVATCSYKGLAYVLPHAALLVAAAFDGTASAKRACIRVAANYALGVGIAIAATLGVVVLSGHWHAYMDGLRAFVGRYGAEMILSPDTLLIDLAIKYPLLSLAALAVPIHAAVTWRNQHRLSHAFVTTFYFAWALVVLAINPSPYPYNVLHLAPYALLAALDTADWLRETRRTLARAAIGAGVASMLGVFALMVPVDNYLAQQNALQLAYMDAAEALTSPTDAVLDAVGLVPTRRPPGRDWMLHTSFMNAYSDRQRQHFADLMLSAKPPVAIINYRWNWLSRRDHETLRRYYAPLAPSFCVLGLRSAASTGEFSLLRSGRYAISYGPASAAASIDGQRVTAVQQLEAGHHVFAGAQSGLAVLWLGPHASQLPALPAESALAMVTTAFPLAPRFENQVDLPTDQRLQRKP